MIHQGDSGRGSGVSTGISRRQQAVRQAIPHNSMGVAPNSRMRQLFNLLGASVIEPQTLDYIEEEVRRYNKIWTKREQFLRVQAGDDHAQQGAGPA
jgi:predicted oxidoreductase